MPPITPDPTRDCHRALTTRTRGLGSSDLPEISSHVSSGSHGHHATRRSEGNGTATVLQGRDWAFLHDLYEDDPFPARKEPEDYNVPAQPGLTGVEYLDPVRDSLTGRSIPCGPIVPIPGMKRRSHLDQNVAALDIVLTPEELAKLDATFRPGVAAGERYTPEVARWAGR